MPLSPTPNMGMQKAEPNVTAGPLWAQMLNDIVDILDAHDHSAGKGPRVTPAGMNINADLEMNSNDLIETRSVRLDNQPSALVDSLDKGCLYRIGDNLYYNNSSGAAVQITSGTSVVSSITGAFAATTPGGYPYSVTGSDAQKVLLVDTSSARTINLPAATTAVLFCIKDATGSAGTNNISVVPNGTNTIDGVNATYRLANDFGWWFFISDGVAAWYVAAAIPDIIPAGSISMYGAATAPAGWLLCDGSAVSRTTYARLFAKISTTFGVGDGATTFNLPDMRQRFPIGKAASGTGSTLGGTGGNIDHTHSVPAHFHGMGVGADLNVTASGSHTHTIDHDHGAFTSGAGSAHTHSIDHDHGSVTSGTESADHTHSIDHDHASATTGSSGAHTHFVAADDLTSTTLTNSNQVSSDYNAVNDFSYDLKGSSFAATIGVTSSDGAHTHSLDLPNFTGTSGGKSATHTHAVDLPNFTGTSGSESAHTHSIDVPNFTGTSGSNTHTHASGNFAGRIGLVTGGVDGNAAMTSGTGNPPFLSLQYIIKT